MPGLGQPGIKSTSPKAGPGLFQYGWNLDLVSVPDIAFISLTNCTEAEALSGFSVNGDGALEIDHSAIVTAGAGSDHSFTWTLAELEDQRLAPGASWVIRALSPDEGTDDLGQRFVFSVRDPSLSKQAPPWADSSSATIVHYFKASRKAWLDVWGNLDFNTLMDRNLQSGRIPRFAHDNETHFFVEDLDDSDWDVSTGTSSQVSGVDNGEFLANGIPADHGVDFKVIHNRAGGNTTQPTYVVAQLSIDGVII
jgi:hypothetical protein